MLQKETVPCNRVLIITKPFSISVTNFDAKKSSCYGWVFVEAEIDVSEPSETIILYCHLLIEDHSCK